jgi:hypothetical protein
MSDKSNDIQRDPGAVASADAMFCAAAWVSRWA